MAGLAERFPWTWELSRGQSVPIARVSLRGVRTWPIARQFLLVLIAVFVVKQFINIFIFPPFTGHDEVAHYGYVQTIVSDYRVPIIPNLEEFQQSVGTSRDNLPGDYLPDELYPFCRYTLDWGGCNEARFANNPPHLATLLGEYYPYGWQYAANHPPLYYLLVAPVYRLTESASPTTQLYLMRAAAIPFGLAIVLLAYAMVRTLFPRDLFLAVTVPAFVAFQPQVSYEGAMLNNDIAGIAIFSLILYLLVLGLRRKFPYRLTIWIGFAAGIGLLIKSTTLIALPLVAVAVVLGVGIRDWRGWISRGAVIAAVAGLICWPWYLFLYRTYGNFSALDQVAKLQYAHTYQYVDRPSMLDLFWNSEFAVFRWHETWGLFGWRLIYYSDALLWAIGIPCILASVGLLIYLVGIVVKWRPGGDRVAGFAGIGALESWQVSAIGVIALSAIAAYAAMLQFGTRFSLTQARYFFPAINAYAFLLMLGLRTLLPENWRRYGQAAVVAALVIMTVVIYSQYVIPYWHLES